MRDPHTVFAGLEKVVGTWLDSLDTYTAEQFAATPSPDEWSIGQVYQHLISSTDRVHLANVERCIEGATEAEGGKTPPGEMIFELGALPPTQIKVPPSKEYTPTQPEDRGGVREEMMKILGRAGDLRDRIASASPLSKMAHPALGMLNAGEWYDLIGMHFVHHLRQKDRIETFLGMKG